MSTNERWNEKISGQNILSEKPCKQALNADNDIGDIFYGDQSNNIACDQEITNKQYDMYSNKFYNEGFREALSVLDDKAGAGTSDSKDEHILQSSFDQGYETAFVISKQLYTVRTAIKTYLELLKVDNTNIKHVSELEKLNLDLDAAKIKLDKLVQGEIVILVPPQSQASDTWNKFNSSHEKIVELDEKWRSTFNDIINLQDLGLRCTRLLGTYI